MTTQTTAPVLSQLTCLRCQHTWYPKSPTIPGHCPKCNSPYWNKPRGKVAKDPVKITGKKRFHCFRCDYEWNSALDHPTSCAKCRSAYWDKPKKEKE